jgi:hypothetical protein
LFTLNGTIIPITKRISSADSPAADLNDPKQPSAHSESRLPSIKKAARYPERLFVGIVGVNTCPEQQLRTFATARDDDSWCWVKGTSLLALDGLALQELLSPELCRIDDFLVTE